jgi:effector-binding domain-containing protein
VSGVTIRSVAAVPTAVTRSELPAGDVAALVHRDGYAAIPDAHDQLRRGIEAAGRQPAGVTWEIYADPDEDDMARDVEVEIRHLLAPT